MGDVLSTVHTSGLPTYQEPAGDGACDSTLQNTPLAVDTGATEYSCSDSLMCDSGKVILIHDELGHVDSITITSQTRCTLSITGLTPSKIDSVRFVFASDTSTTTDTSDYILFATKDTSDTIPIEFPPATQFALSVIPATGGTITPAPGDTLVDSADVFTITATDTGLYTFSHWTSTGGVRWVDSTASPATCSLTAVGTITPVFDAPTYTLTLAATNGSTVPTTGDTTVDSGSVINIAATPDAGYIFSHWTDTGSVVYNVDSTTATINGNVLLTAVFAVKQFTLIMNANVHSTTIPPNGDTLVDSGGVVPIGCTPDAGYTFTGWEIVSGELDLGVDSTTVTVNGDGTLKANLIVSNFNINSDTSVTITVPSDTVFWGTPPLTDTIYAGIRWTINKMIDFSGTTDARNSLISNSTGDMDTITKPQDTIQNVFCRDQWFTNPQYLSEITGGGDNYNEKYLPSYDSVVIRDWFRQSGKITCNWLRVTATDSAYFNDTIIVRDSVIYDIGTKPFGATGSLMLSTPGYVCRVKTNGIRNLPRIIKKGPGGIKWD